MDVTFNLSTTKSDRSISHHRYDLQVLSTPEYLSNKAVHLFLQTGLSVDKIRLNIEGLRDDDVPAFPIVDKRTNSRNGFSEIFGDFL